MENYYLSDTWTSIYLSKLLRSPLGCNFHQRVVTWIEQEIDDLNRSIEHAEIQEEREPWRRPANLDG